MLYAVNSDLLAPATKFGQGNVLQVSVILLTGGVCLSACWIPPQEQTHPQEQTPPQEQTSPKSRHPPPGPHPRGKLRGIRSRPMPKGKLRGIRSRPTPKGEIEGDHVQAHT